MLLATLILLAWQGSGAHEAGIDRAGTPLGYRPRLSDSPDMNTQELLETIRFRVDAAEAERASAIVLAAATMPGRREPDPPTGPLAAAPSRQDADPRSGPGSEGANANGTGLRNGNGNGNGFKWRFAPIQWSGNLSFDGRWSRDGDNL